MEDHTSRMYILWKMSAFKDLREIDQKLKFHQYAAAAVKMVLDLYTTDDRLSGHT